MNQFDKGYPGYEQMQSIARDLNEIEMRLAHIDERQDAMEAAYTKASVELHTMLDRYRRALHDIVAMSHVEDTTGGLIVRMRQIAREALEGKAFNFYNLGTPEE